MNDPRSGPRRVQWTEIEVGDEPFVGAEHTEPTFRSQVRKGKRTGDPTLRSSWDGPPPGCPPPFLPPSRLPPCRDGGRKAARPGSKRSFLSFPSYRESLPASLSVREMSRRSPGPGVPCVPDDRKGR